MNGEEIIITIVRRIKKKKKEIELNFNKQIEIPRLFVSNVELVG